MDESWEYLRLFDTYPHALPRSGGLYDQSASYVRAMRLLFFATKTMEADALKEIERPPDSIPGQP